MNALRQMRLAARAESKRFGHELVEIPRSQWPVIPGAGGRAPMRAWRNRDFLVQLWEEPTGGALRAPFRLSVNRSELANDGRWKDGITWDELQALKAAAGFGDRWAVECYPPDQQVVNVANIRHLWLLEEPPRAFGWTGRGPC